MGDLRWLEVELDFCFSSSNETSAETSTRISICGENIRRKLHRQRTFDKFKFFLINAQ